MRLIDVDNVISVAEGEFSEEDVSKIRWLLSHIGTAYDIDKVIEELEKLQKETFSYAFKRCDDFYNGQARGLDKAIEIVKREKR